MCVTISVKNEILKMLKEHNVNHHTFTEAAKKSISFVLKGYDLDFTLSETLEDLRIYKVPAVNVTTIVKSWDNRRAIHLVLFHKDSEKINHLNHQFKTINGAKISWEEQIQEKKRPIQCNNCQRWATRVL